MDLTEEICSVLSVSSTEIVKKATSTQLAINYSDLIDAIISTNDLPEAASILNIHRNTLQRLLTKLYPELGRQRTWHNFFLTLIPYKKCNSCKEIKPFTEFSKDSKNPCELCSICRTCDNMRSTMFRSTHLEQCKETVRKHYIDNKSDYVARNAKRRASQIDRTPSWANLDIIKRVYACCPEDCHVDHKVPLQGDIVSGLHVESNLQYLTAEENLHKGNKLLDEFVNSNFT